MLQTVLSNPLFTPIVVMVVIIALFPLVAGYIVLVERKVLADFQVRLGPMRVGPHGLLQPIADALKLLLKEDIIPAESDKAIFWFAPCVSTITALTAFSVLPFARRGTIEAQPTHHIWFLFDNYGFMIVPFAVYLIAATAEPNRAPFDLPE